MSALFGDFWPLPSATISKSLPPPKLHQNFPILTIFCFLAFLSDYWISYGLLLNTVLIFIRPYSLAYFPRLVIEIRRNYLHSNTLTWLGSSEIYHYASMSVCQPVSTSACQHIRMSVCNTLTCQHFSADADADTDTTQHIHFSTIGFS